MNPKVPSRYSRLPTWRGGFAWRVRRKRFSQFKSSEIGELAEKRLYAAEKSAVEEAAAKAGKLKQLLENVATRIQRAAKTAEELAGRRGNSLERPPSSFGDRKRFGF